MSDDKKARYIRDMTRVRNVNQAQNLAKRRRQGKAPDTVLHSAWIIGIDTKKKCPVVKHRQDTKTY